MARTFIGELILRLRDDSSGKAKQAAAQISGAMKNIEDSARRLNAAPWGGKFQQQLNKLGASAKDIDQLRSAWDRLHASMSGRSLSSALQRSEIGNWKSAVLGNFIQQQQAVRRELDETKRHYKNWQTAIQGIGRSGLVMMGGYTGVYMGGVAARGGLTASAQWEREKFRGRMTGMPVGEQDQILDRSEQLGMKYPSASITDIAEMARSARSMMGSTEGGLAVLEEMVKGMVTLQSAQGTDNAVGQLRNLLRGIDNLGKNSTGATGLRDTREIIGGMIRAAQIEGADLDIGKLFSFARRAKIAGPGLSTEFVSTASPAMMQDMTPEGFGTALSSAYQAFVIGSNAVASKKNIEAQHELGIRGKGGLVDAKLFGQDPYAWVKRNLAPALQKAGVDMQDETAVAQAVAKLTRNTMASGLLTRLITQMPQIDRLRQQYGMAMGPEAADEALRSDPFVALEGFISSLKNLSAAVGEDTMPTIVSGLNSLAAGINNLQNSWRDGDAMTKLGIGAGAGAAGFGAYKVLAGLWALTTAGPALNAAAVSLQAAAVSLGGPGVAGAGGGGRKKGAGWFGGAATFIASLPFLLSGSSADQDLSPEEIKRNRMKYWEGWSKRNYMIPERPTGYQGSEAQLGGQRAASGGGNPLQSAVDNATRVGRDMQDALSVTARPNVDSSSIDAAIAKARQLLGLFQQVGEASRNAESSVNREMNRSFSDQGVMP